MQGEFNEQLRPCLAPNPDNKTGVNTYIPAVIAIKHCAINEAVLTLSDLQVLQTTTRTPTALAPVPSVCRRTSRRHVRLVLCQLPAKWNWAGSSSGDEVKGISGRVRGEKIETFKKGWKKYSKAATQNHSRRKQDCALHAKRFYGNPANQCKVTVLPGFVLLFFLEKKR